MKPLINMVQIFTSQQDPKSQYTVTIDEDNLVSRIGPYYPHISAPAGSYSDMMDGMKKIVSREEIFKLQKSKSIF